MNYCFNILQWNTRSLTARLLDLPNILFAYKISVALLSESWLRSNSKVNIPNYNIIRSDRPDGYGGAAIIVHISILFRAININPNLPQALILNYINLVGIEIFINPNNKLDLWSC